MHKRECARQPPAPAAAARPRAPGVVEAAERAHEVRGRQRGAALPAVAAQHEALAGQAAQLAAAQAEARQAPVQRQAGRGRLRGDRAHSTPGAELQPSTPGW